LSDRNQNSRGCFLAWPVRSKCLNLGLFSSDRCQKAKAGVAFFAFPNTLSCHNFGRPWKLG
jgi:hypothetical protein